jgi:hypothetical protein
VITSKDQYQPAHAWSALFVIQSVHIFMKFSLKNYGIFQIEKGQVHFCLFVLGFTSHRHSIGHIATFQLYW